MLDALETRPPDPLLKLIDLYRADPRPQKIDLGVGVYNDEHGRTPVFAAVKLAEARLLEEQDTKAYVGAAGDQGFLHALREMLFGQSLSASLGARLSALQATGGTGALRLGADLAARAGTPVAVVGAPAWPNHGPILEAARLPIAWYDYFDPETQAVRFDRLVEALQAAEPGSLVLLQASCHNPTGADLDLGQWGTVAELVVARGLLPFLDVAYAGLGAGMDQDMAGVRLVLQQAPEAMVAVSGAKSFGLYRERVGALFMLGRSEEAARRALSNALAFARVSYSMPPDHGAAVVRIVLESPALAESWAGELEAMRRRIMATRERFAAAGVAVGLNLGGLARQAGMFSTLPLSQDEVLRLRSEDAVYMTDAARLNVAALTGPKIEVVVRALARLAVEIKATA